MQIRLLVQQRGISVARKMVRAPEGYHWMKKGKEFVLMKNPKDGYKRHRGSFLNARFEVIKEHKKKK